MNTFLKHRPRSFLLIAAVLWFGLYKTLEPLSHMLVDALPLEPRQPSVRCAAILPVRHAQGVAAAGRGGDGDGHDQFLLHAGAHPRPARRAA